MLLQLLFPGLTEIGDLSFHVLDVGNLVIAFLCHLRFFIRAQGRRLQLLVQIVDFIQCFFVSFRPIVIFFLGGILSLVDLCFGFLGLVVILKCALHIDRSDFQRALCKSRNGKGKRQRKDYGQRLFHKTGDTVAGIALDCNHIYSFKIDNQH